MCLLALYIAYQRTGSRLPYSKFTDMMQHNFIFVCALGFLLELQCENIFHPRVRLDTFYLLKACVTKCVPSVFCFVGFFLARKSSFL